MAWDLRITQKCAKNLDAVFSSVLMALPIFRMKCQFVKYNKIRNGKLPLSQRTCPRAPGLSMGEFGRFPNTAGHISCLAYLGPG